MMNLSACEGSLSTETGLNIGGIPFEMIMVVAVNPYCFNSSWANLLGQMTIDEGLYIRFIQIL